MNDFEKSMFIFFDEWGGSPHFQAEHDVLFFFGVEVEELIDEGEFALMNKLYDLGWKLTWDANGFESSRWGSS